MSKPISPVICIAQDTGRREPTGFDD